MNDAKAKTFEIDLFLFFQLAKAKLQWMITSIVVRFI